MSDGPKTHPGNAARGHLPAFDAVEHPKHYKSHPSGIEVIEITKHENFCIGNVIKYVLRAEHKGKHLEDLRKARQYLDFEIERVESLASS